VSLPKLLPMISQPAAGAAGSFALTRAPGVQETTASAPEGLAAPYLGHTTCPLLPEGSFLWGLAQSQRAGAEQDPAAQLALLFPQASHPQCREQPSVLQQDGSALCVCVRCVSVNAECDEGGAGGYACTTNTRIQHLKQRRRWGKYKVCGLGQLRSRSFPNAARARLLVVGCDRRFHSSSFVPTEGVCYSCFHLLLCGVVFIGVHHLSNDCALRVCVTCARFVLDAFVAFRAAAATMPRKDVDPSSVKASTAEIFAKAGKRALGGGIPGAAAMGMQVGLLMWMRTTMNYQYRHGTTTMEALKTLYRQGGIPRFYKGVGPALLQGPLSRFGDTAANAGVLSLLNQTESTKDLPVAAKTMCASAAAAAWRVNLMPIDATKTIMQVEGKNGFPSLVKKVRASGFRVLYHGAMASFSATFVGHFPWFFTFNYLDANIPKPEETLQKLARNAVIGFSSSVVSDTCSNSVRVVKTYKQTSTVAVTYPETIRSIVNKDGLVGLFGRGLKTRILTNGMQGLLFTVLWKFMEEKFNARMDKNDDDKESKRH